MAQTVVQTSANISLIGTNGSVLMPGVGAGNLLVVGIINDSDGTTNFTVSDDKGDIWTNVVSAGHGSPVNGLVCISYANNVTGGNTTVTVTAGSSITFNFYVFEVSGSATASVVGASDSNFQISAATHEASASGISTSAGAFVLMVGVESTSATNTPETGWTALTGAHGYDIFEWIIETSPLSAEHGTWTTGTATVSVAAIAAFLTAAGGAGSAGPLRPIIINPAVYPAILE